MTKTLGGILVSIPDYSSMDESQLRSECERKEDVILTLKKTLDRRASTIDALVKQIGTLQNEISDLKTQISICEASAKALATDTLFESNNMALEEITALSTALDFYATPSNYEPLPDQNNPFYGKIPVILDGGMRARREQSKNSSVKAFTQSKVLKSKVESQRKRIKELESMLGWEK